MRYFFLISLFILSIQASGKEDPLYTDIKKLCEKVLSPDEIPKHAESSMQLKNKLVKLLTKPRSYTVSFKSLAPLHVKESPDKKFRILSWSYENEGGLWCYDHVIQFRDPRKNVLKNEAYVGYKAPMAKAIYYEIIPPLDKRKRYYLLLGWKHLTPLKNVKIIEPLSFSDDKAVFGRTIFKTREGAARERIIFQYSSNAHFTLVYQKDKKRIVVDNLAIMGDVLVPDGSYNALEFKKGKWVLKENIQP